MVTAAAVLAFIWGGLGILFGLIGIAAGSVLNSASDAVCSDSRYLTSDTAAACDSVSGIGTFLIIVTIVTIVIAGLMIWGGVVALNGKNGQILVIACAVYAVLAIISVIGSSFAFSYLLGIVIPILIAVFMLNSQSRAWFRARGGKTFCPAPAPPHASSDKRPTADCRGPLSCRDGLRVDGVSRGRPCPRSRRPPPPSSSAVAASARSPRSGAAPARPGTS